MEIWEMREHLKKCPKYESPNWSNRVDSMSGNQVIAIYKSFIQKDMFRPISKKRKDIFGEPFVKFTQPTLFDIFPEAMGRKVEVK